VRRKVESFNFHFSVFSLVVQVCVWVLVNFQFVSDAYIGRRAHFRGVFTLHLDYIRLNVEAQLIFALFKKKERKISPFAGCSHCK
jgi:hypothetical protein